MRSISLQTVDKVIFVQRKVLGNEEFPKWNPQTGFISVEENSEFQGFSRWNELFMPLFEQVEILIST